MTEDKNAVAKNLDSVPCKQLTFPAELYDDYKKSPPSAVIEALGEFVSLDEAVFHPGGTEVTATWVKRTAVEIDPKRIEASEERRRVAQMLVEIFGSAIQTAVSLEDYESAEAFCELRRMVIAIREGKHLSNSSILENVVIQGTMTL